jgi:formate/nitrite transporter FocA (FNT family)
MRVGPEQLFPGKKFKSTILEVFETKTKMSGSLTTRYLQRAAMAGILIGLLYCLNFAVVAAFAAVPAGKTTLQTIGTLAGALAFGWALVFIYYSKSELLTSNMMIVSIGWYYRRTSWARALRLLGLCFVGNALGGFLVAVLLRFSTIADGAPLKLMEAAVAHKLDFISSGPAGWGDLLVRAILCNFMINLAMLLVYAGLIKDDFTKSLVMITSVFTFVFLGFEHSVANTVLFSIVGLKEGIDLALAAGNLGIALLGNFIGGGLLIGIYYAYINDDAAYLRAHPASAAPASPGCERRQGL